MGRLQRISTWILMVGLISVPLLAQTTSTTGALIAVITDADGKGLPGVTVSITSPSLQGARSTTTNANGEATFPQIAPGNYRVESALSGFESQIRDTIVVSLTKVTKVNLTMTLARVSEAITVSGNTVVIDPTQTNTQTNLKEDFLKYASVGQNGRDYLTALEVVPGVADQDGAGGNPSFFGANLGQNSYTIDGLNTTDNVTHTFSANFGFDAIQEIAVQSGGYEAEYGRAVGGIVNVITKSGGNQFSGTVDARYSSDKLTEQGSRRSDTPPGTNALANDKNRRDFRTLQPEASVGGPILKDKVWFFADAQRILNQSRAFASQGFEPGRRDFTGWNLFAKVTTTPVSNQTVRFQYTNSYADVPNGEGGSQFYRQEAAQTSYQKLELYNLGWDAVLNDKWTANLQGGINVNYLIFEPISKDLLTTGVIDQATGIRSVNYTNFQESSRNRKQALGSTTYYLEALGSHAIKVGADIQWDEFRSVNNTTGTPPAGFCSPDFGQPDDVTSCGAILRPIDGEPDRLDITTNLPRQKFNGVGQAYYAQDEWRPIPNLTVKLGARYDQNSYENNLGQHIKTLNRLQPRFGVAFDVFNNSTTVFRAQAGEFMDDLGLSLPSYLTTTGAVTSVFFFNGSTYDFAGTFGGPSGNLIDPSLRASYSQEANVGITQRIFTNTSIDVSYVYRRARNIIEDSCAFDNCNTDGTFWLTNHPGNGLGEFPRSDYHGTLVTIQSRPTDRMNILASYTYSTSKGSIEYTQNAGADFDVFPDHFVNRYGYLSDDARHRFKIDGYYRFPFDITFGTHFYWDSGIPYNITTTDTPAAGYDVRYLEPRGSRRLPHFYQWDAQLQKDVVVGRLRIGLIGSVYNVLNTEIAVLKDGSVGTSPDVAGSDNPNFNLNTAYQRPRRYEVGFRLEF
ncbi:MAG: TonB-dependent receptor [Acidobacteriota bacterium]